MAEQRVTQVGVLVAYEVDESTDEQRVTQSGALVAYIEEPPEPTDVMIAVWWD